MGKRCFTKEEAQGKPEMRLRSFCSDKIAEGYIPLTQALKNSVRSLVPMPVAPFGV
jgi:hypothetical protein